MSTKIKTNSGWKTVGNLLPDTDEVHDVGKQYIFNMSLTEKEYSSGANWYTNELTIDTSSLPDGIYICQSRGLYALTNGCSCILRLTSDGMTNIGYNHAISYSMLQGETITQLNFVFIRAGNRGSKILVSRYQNLESKLYAQNFPLVFTRIA